MGLLSFFKKGKQNDQETEQKRQAQQEQQETVVIPAKIDGCEIAYQYEKVDVALSSGVDLNRIFGQRVTLGQNCIQYNGQTIGRIANDKLSDMVNDWLKRGDPVYAVVSRINEGDYFAAIDLYFYRNELQYLLRRYPDAKRYKLTGNRRGELQDNISYCSSGDKCSIYYDIEKEKYLVSDGAFDIGYLPAAASKIVEDQGESKFLCYIASIASDDDGVDEVLIYAFPCGR